MPVTVAEELNTLIAYFASGSTVRWRAQQMAEAFPWETAAQMVFSEGTVAGPGGAGRATICPWADPRSPS
jgi:hypothetical protein